MPQRRASTHASPQRRAWRIALAALFLLLMAGPVPGQADPLVGDPARIGRDAFVARMAAAGEDPDAAAARWTLAQALIADGSLIGDRAIMAFLATPRHIFARDRRLTRTYADAPLPIGYGQTISAPHMVARMTSELDVAAGDRVLEVGTGSGYQAAVLAHLTEQVYSIEIIEPLAQETAALYATLIEGGAAAYAQIAQRTGDGYYGWPEGAPFDRIIVTAAVDHIPPPLLDQLAVGGRMLIPVGPPQIQVLLEVTKTVDPDGQVRIVRRDVYDGRARVRFVPLTRDDGRPWSR